MGFTTRVLLMWVLLLVLAILNGALREGVFVPWWGAARAHVASTALLSLLIITATGGLRDWLALADDRSALLVGGAWVAFTLAFEFLAGHFLFQKPWPELLADYDVAHGRIWPIVLVVTLLAPWGWRRIG